MFDSYRHQKDIYIAKAPRQGQKFNIFANMQNDPHISCSWQDLSNNKYHLFTS